MMDATGRSPSRNVTGHKAKTSRTDPDRNIVAHRTRAAGPFIADTVQRHDGRAALRFAVVHFSREPASRSCWQFLPVGIRCNRPDSLGLFPGFRYRPLSAAPRNPGKYGNGCAFHSIHGRHFPDYPADHHQQAVRLGWSTTARDTTTNGWSIAPPTGETSDRIKALEELRRLPEVEEVGSCSLLPVLTGNNGNGATLNGRTLFNFEDLDMVDTGFVRTMGIKIIDGKMFEAGAPKTFSAMVSC